MHLYNVVQLLKIVWVKCMYLKVICKCLSMASCGLGCIKNCSIFKRKDN